MIARRWSTALSVLLTVSFLAACSGAAPDGFRTVEQNRLKVDVVDDWQPGDFDVGSMWDVVLQDDPEDEDATYRFVASSDFPDKTARLALGQARLFSAFGPPDESGGMSQVFDDDDKEMWRWDFTYNDGEFQVVAWALSDKSTQHIVVAAVTGAGGLADTTIDAIQESLEILPPPAE